MQEVVVTLQIGVVEGQLAPQVCVRDALHLPRVIVNHDAAHIHPARGPLCATAVRLDLKAAADMGVDTMKGGMPLRKQS